MFYKKESNGFSSKAIKQITTVFCIQACSSITFAVFFSGLSLYLTNSLHFQKNNATSITAVFLAFNYFLPIVGGTIANKFVSYKKLFLTGTFVSAMGCILLAYTSYFYLGFSAFLMTSLVSSVCLNMFITQLFPESAKAERRIAFIWNYIGMNFGFMLGFILTGVFSLNGDYKTLFLIMAMFTLITLFLALFFIDEPKLNKTLRVSKIKQLIYGVSTTLLIVAVLTQVFHHANGTERNFTFFLVATLFVYLLWTFKNTEKKFRYKFVTFALYMLIATLFWSAYMLTPTAIIQIIDNDVNRHMFGILLAPQWFQNIDSAIIILMGPLLAYCIRKRKKSRGEENDSSIYFSMGLAFVFVAFLFFIVGLYFSSEQVRLSAWIMFGYLALLTFGEIAIAPAGDALIGELIPEKLRGVMTGIWKTNMGISVMISGLIAKSYILPYVKHGGLTRSFNHSLISLYGVFCVLIILVLVIIKSVTISKMSKLDTDQNMQIDGGLG